MIKEMFTYEADDRVVLERNTITDQEAMQLACVGYLTINGHTWFRKCRYDNRLQADNGKQPGDLLVEHRTAVFLLTQDQSQAQPCTRSLLHLKEDPVKESLREIEERRRRPYEFASRETLRRRLIEEKEGENRPRVIKVIEKLRNQSKH